MAHEKEDIQVERTAGAEMQRQRRGGLSGQVLRVWNMGAGSAKETLLGAAGSFGRPLTG